MRLLRQSFGLPGRNRNPITDKEMKKLLTLLPILGLLSMLNLTTGCPAGTANVGDDTPPPEGEDGYDGGGADTEVEGDVKNLKSPDFDKDSGKEE